MDCWYFCTMTCATLDGEAMDLAMTGCGIAGFSMEKCASLREALEGFAVVANDPDFGGDELDLCANLLFAHGRQGRAPIQL